MVFPKDEQLVKLSLITPKEANLLGELAALKTPTGGGFINQLGNLLRHFGEIRKTKTTNDLDNLEATHLRFGALRDDVSLGTSSPYEFRSLAKKTKDDYIFTQVVLK